MNQASFRITRTLLVAAAFALSSCGGGGSGGASGTSPNCSNPAGLITSFGTPTGTNVVPLTVDGGPTVNGARIGTINQAYVTITICVPGTTTCQSIDHVWIDTGSYGLRLFSSTFTSSLPVSMQNGNAVANCGQFVSTYTWGAVRTADIKIGSESASSIPIQVIGDSAVPATAPGGCVTAMSTALATPTDMGANGLLGIGVFLQDCGTGCAMNAVSPFYYTCPAGTCSPVTMATNLQLQNVVGQFTTVDNGVLDNNGVLMQIPSIPPQGQSTANGWLIFGINTQSNNQLGSALVFAVSTLSFINTTTTYGSTTNMSSYVDSGSNGWFFNNPALATCSGASSGFFCQTAMLSATMLPFTGTSPSHTYSFCVENMNDGFLGTGFAAFNDVGGPMTAGTFDWGLPFFYGRSVFTAFEGAAIGGNPVPFFAASTP